MVDIVVLEDPVERDDEVPTLADEYDDFLTLPGYDLIVSTRNP